MRGKVIHSSYRDGACTSYVRKSTKYGEFSAVTAAADEDKDIANQWDGCRFAEYLCDMKAMKARMQVMKERYLGILQGFNNVKQAIDIHDTNCDTAYIVRLWKRQIKHAYNQFIQAQEQYDNMKANYKVFCTNVLNKRRETREQIDQLHQEASE